MTHRVVTALLIFVSAAFLVLLMYPNMPVYFDRISGQKNAPMLYLVQLAVSLALIPLAWSRVRPFLTTPFALWILSLLIMYALTWLRLVYFNDTASADEIGHARDRLERALLIPSFAIVCYLCARRKLELLFIFAIFLVPLPIIVGFVSPDLFPSSATTRSAGTYGNANQAATAVLFWFLIVARRVPRLIVLILYLLTGLAVILTFSRSGMVGWALLGAYLIYRRSISRLVILLPILFALAYSTLIFQAEELLSRYIDSEAQVDAMMERLDLFGKVGEDGEEFDDSSTVQRELVARDTFFLTLQKPFFGYGFEVEHDLGLNAHNAFLQLWYTFGVAGLFMYLWLVRLLYLAGIQMGYGRISPFLLLFVWFSFFDHSHVTDHYWLIAYSYLFVNLTRKSASYSPSKSKKRPRKRRRRKSRHREPNQYVLEVGEENGALEGLSKSQSPRRRRHRRVRRNINPGT